MPGQDIPAVQLQVLCGLGADRRPHSGRTLLAHLAGTRALLAAWGCAEAVCTAGLFHSIYGTNAFPVASLGQGARAALAQLIGAEAERLAYLFCASDRPQAFLDGLSRPRLLDRHTGVRVPLEPATLRSLIEIECANLVEQGDGEGFLRAILAVARSGGPPPVGPGVLAGVAVHLRRGAAMAGAPT